MTTENITESNMQLMFAEILALKNQLQGLQLQSQVQAETTAAVASVAANNQQLVQYVLADPIVHPEKFSANKSSYSLNSFKMATERAFELSGNRFPDDRSKIIYIGNLLEGPARRWYDSIQSRSSDETRLLMSNLDHFWSAMAAYFGIKESRIQVELKLLRFRQDKLSVVDYATRFKNIASTIDYPERPLIAIFISNLNEKTMAYLRHQSNFPDRLEDLIQLCIRSDDDYLGQNKSFGSHHLSFRDDNKMDVSAVDRDYSDLVCNYCRKKGHIKRNCTILLKKAKGEGSSDPKAQAARQ